MSCATHPRSNNVLVYATLTGTSTLPQICQNKVAYSLSDDDSKAQTKEARRDTEARGSDNEHVP